MGESGFKQRTVGTRLQRLPGCRQRLAGLSLSIRRPSGYSERAASPTPKLRWNASRAGSENSSSSRRHTCSHSRFGQRRKLSRRDLETPCSIERGPQPGRMDGGESLYHPDDSIGRT
jgi:hypothetical protein